MQNSKNNKTTQNDLFAKEGWIIIGVSLVLSIVGAIFHWAIGVVFSLFALFSLYFFRNPKRVPANNDKHIISPADGKIIFIGEANERYFSKDNRQKISIFMSPFNVHVNRAPVTGEVTNVHYQKGKFLAAFDQKASLENEQSAIEMQTPDAKKIVFVQIAGWLARRIVSYPKQADRLQKGEIFGVIRFGSRMDVYFPAGVALKVKMNQHVKAGETLLAEFL